MAEQSQIAKTASQKRRPSAQFTAALPAYRGGKRRLAPVILAAVSEQLPRMRWGDSLLLDPFAGGCAFALHAKACGFRVLASDLAARSTITARALIANSSVRITETDALQLFAPPPAGYSRVAVDYVGRAFTTAQADFLDRAVAQAMARSEPMRCLLLLVIIKFALRLQPMSVLDATDAPAAITGDFDRISSRRTGHYLRAARAPTLETLWAIARQVNSGVFGGAGEAMQGDARSVIAATAADVLYLDPPYPGTAGYTDAYAPLDAILGDHELSGAPPTLDELFEAAHHIPLVALSYGGPTETLESLVERVARHRPVLRAIAVPYPHLQSIARKERSRANREFIVIAGC